MGKKLIIAHYMHEQEMGIAIPMMDQVEETTEGYVLGVIDEDKIQELKEKGLIIQELEEKLEAETPGKDPEPVLGFKFKRAHSNQKSPSRRPNNEPGIKEIDPTLPNFYLIGLKGPLLEKWRANLKQLGIELLQHVPQNYYTARLNPKQVDDVNNLPFISSIKPYGPEDTGPIVNPLSTPLTNERKMVTYDILLHIEEDLDKVLDWLKDHNVNIAGAKRRKIRIYLLDDSPFLEEIANLPEVALGPIEYIQPKLHNDIARIILGIDYIENNDVKFSTSQTGDGQIIAVADTGLDKNHPDFEGRINAIIPLGRPNDVTDFNGHGTHVAGSILGSGAASGGKIRGIAPKAELFFQSLLDNNGGLGGLPLYLGDLFEEAYQADARIHNNSWGAATSSMYTIDSFEIDEFVAEHRDMLIVISAGNEGQAANCRNSQPGFVDWLSIGSPASSKNALTVGASRSRRNSGGYSQFTYGFTWPNDFPDPPIANERISGNPECIAAFSSRGPCDDRRIKPDVVVPGTDIASTKSSCAPLRNFWGPYPGYRNYAFMGGTSMAAPLASGFAALVREYYIKERDHKPSAALLKATIINSTRWLTGPDAISDHPYQPNYHQGFGCIYMPWAIPNLLNPDFKLEFVDSWEDPKRQFSGSGKRFRFEFSISGGKWLRICLVWTDPPGRALQNNLNLFVQYEPPTGQKWIGNENLPMGLKIPDPDNNVEVVHLEDPPIGEYLIQVTATNLLHTPQDFALVITGELSSSLKQIL